MEEDIIQQAIILAVKDGNYKLLINKMIILTAYALMNWKIFAFIDKNVYVYIDNRNNDDINWLKIKNSYDESNI